MIFFIGIREILSKSGQLKSLNHLHQIRMIIEFRKTKKVQVQIDFLVNFFKRR